MSSNNGDIGNRIQETVAEALSTGEFSKLNSEIRSTVISVLNEVGDQLNGAVSAAKGNDRGFTQPKSLTYGDREVARHQQERQQLIKRPEKKVKFKDIGGVSGYLGMIGGTIVLIESIALAVAISPFFLLITALAGGIIGKSGNTIKLNKLANRYKKLCSEKLYIGIDAISNATGTSQKKVIKNVKKILAKGFFPEGYIDEDNTTLMVSKEVYDQYIDTKMHAAERLIEQNREQQQQATASRDAELKSMVSKGMQYIDRLHELNDIIPGEVISNKLSKLEQLLNEIFNRVNEHPEQMDKCGKLMDYYLPTMIKLVEAYAEYDKVSAPGPDIISAKAEIENTLGIINQAFVELLNKLYQNSVWDVKSDAKVLQTMLRQEGLTSDELAGLVDEVEDFGMAYTASEPQVQTKN